MHFDSSVSVYHILGSILFLGRIPHWHNNFKRDCYLVEFTVVHYHFPGCIRCIFFFFFLRPDWYSKRDIQCGMCLLQLQLSCQGPWYSTPWCPLAHAPSSSSHPAKVSPAQYALEAPGPGLLQLQLRGSPNAECPGMALGHAHSSSSRHAKAAWHIQST